MAIFIEKRSMKREASFDRLRQALLRTGEPDFVPLMEFYIHPDIKDEFLIKNAIEAPEDSIGRKNVEREVCFWCTAGYDYVPLEISLRWHPLKVEGTVLSRARESLFLDYTRGRGSRGWVELVRGMISDMEDFQSFPWPSADELDYSPLEQISEFLPRGVKVIVQPGRLFQGVWAFMGFEHFCLALTDQPGLVEKMFDLLGRVQLGLVCRALQFDCVGAVWMGDDLAHSSGLMIAPQYFRRLVYPWYCRMAEACRANNAVFIFHSDGKIDDALEDLIGCGVQAVHPLEPLSMDIAAVKQCFGDRLAVIGNVDLSYTLTRGTMAEVEVAVKNKIRRLAPGGGYCLGSENSIPEYVPFDNYEAMRRTALHYGRYPIADSIESNEMRNVHG
jgi:uroporphyrinogen decarboxylase